MLMITSTPAPDPESSVDLDTVAHSWMRRWGNVLSRGI